MKDSESFPPLPSPPPQSSSRSPSPVPQTIAATPAATTTTAPAPIAPVVLDPPSISVPAVPSPSTTPPPPPPQVMTVAHGRQPYEQSSLKLRPGLSVQSASAPPGQLPLLTSGDSYISQVPSSYVGTSTSLAELAHLVKLQTYQEHKNLQSRVRLHKALVSSAVSARLTRSGEICHKALVDHFKSDQKSDFATLYNALHDVRNSCEATRRFAMLEQELDSSRVSNSSDDRESPRGLTSFLHEIPVQARDTILSFISMVRTNPSFLANRLGRLSNAELEALVKHHQQPNPQESILPQQTSRRGNSANRSAPVQKPTEASPVEKLLSFHRNDPLYTLVHSIFANSTGPDSAEDKCRTDVWATTCAKMICENKGESFLLVVMDSWAAMREWPAKQNLEITVMGLLQEGAFLIERGDEAAAGNSASELRGKHDLHAEEFWVKAEKRLFEVLDDEPSAGGIPEGILELGHAILEKIDDPKKQRQAEIIILVKWFFNRFLTNGIAYPEYHGIMSGHHISEHARLKILRPVLKKMYNHAVSVVFGDWKTVSPVEPVIRSHIESMLQRFRCPRPTDFTPVLLPTKAVTSPRETAEVQPFIVLCSADIVTLYQALYPQGSQIVEGRDIKGGAMSSRSSSRPLFGRSPNTGFEIGSGSVLSNSGSSVTSESASITSPLLDRSSIPDDRRSFMSMPSPGSFSIHSQTIQPDSEQDSPENFKMEVRSAVEAMMGRLGPDTVSGRCHPCAEKWAVIFVSPDGKELSVKMRKHWDDDDDDDDDCGHDSDSEDEGPMEVSGLDRVYHQLKEAVMKLVSEYEIPEEPLPERTKFSNRPSAAKAKSAPNASTVDVPESTLDPSNPFHPQSNLTAMITAGQSKAPALDRSRGAGIKNDKPKQRGSAQEPTLLLAMLQAASAQCLARGDYVSSQQYHRALLQARKLPLSLQRDEFGALLHIFSRGARDVIERSAAGTEECEAWFVWLTLAQERHDKAVENVMRKIKDLRDKMWYVTDVRNSAAYDEARNVALALKKMGMPQRPKAVTKSNTRSNLSHRMSTSSFALLKSDTLIDILAATAEHGGPNKLSDDQASMTFEYLSRYSVENFCKGEERIHRFCLEIDKCVTKLVGDGILDGPVLWSSDLFSRDEREMAIGRQRGDLYLAGVGTLSITGDDDDYHTEDGRSSKRGLDILRRPSTSDLFGRNRAGSVAGSFHDGPPSRKGRARSNAGLMDSKEDLFGMPSPSLPSESHNTFWSPFSSHASANASSSRPKAAHSPATLSKSPEAINQQKRKFLAELKQSLTGLLLSDLGLEVFSQGSETDAWFSGGLGDECIQRKEEQEEAKRKAVEKNSSKLAAAPGGKKGLGRKKSMKNVRKTANHGTFEALGKDKKGELAAPVATLENVGREAHSGEENSSSSDATAVRPFGFTAVKKSGLLAFPFLHAFKKLLLRFSTHPNPFQKLQAIYELELLIVAMLSSRSPTSLQGRKSLASMPTSPFLEAMGDAASRICNLQLAQPSNIEEAMANLEERRSNVISNGAVASPFTAPSGTRSPTAHTAAPSADMIVDVLQTLFRQAEVRPKTLFRDLQYVAAFVPASILDRTEVGKAFWDTGLAALGLKQDVCRTMVEIGDEIVAKDSCKRGPESGKEKGGRGDNDNYSRYSMQDAATMWTITAKEGDPTAQRELAIFYLTNPTLLPRSTKPLSKPRDTFRPEMMVQKGEDPDKRDPATMCVAYHWMELSAQGGDEVAREYLRSQREEW